MPGKNTSRWDVNILDDFSAGIILLIKKLIYQLRNETHFRYKKKSQLRLLLEALFEILPKNLIWDYDFCSLPGVLENQFQTVINW